MRRDQLALGRVDDGGVVDRVAVLLGDAARGEPRPRLGRRPRERLPARAVERLGRRPHVLGQRRDPVAGWPHLGQHDELGASAGELVDVAERPREVLLTSRGLGQPLCDADRDPILRHARPSISGSSTITCCLLARARA